MAVRIRLSRIGRKKTPFYSLVAIDSRSKRDGAFLSNIGTYDGLKGSVVSFNEDMYKDWISKGAIPSDSAKKVYRTYKRSLKKESGAAEATAVKKTAAPKKATKSAKAENTEAEATVSSQE